MRNSNSASSLSQAPKVSTKPGIMPTITTKRASLGVNRTKAETDNSKVGIPKAAGLSGPPRSVPKPASVSDSGACIKEVKTLC
ncbi:hypothetical protein AgCh_038881 [Apium graveolens]